MVEIRWTPQAIDDLRNIFDNISHDSRVVAKVSIK